MTALALSLLSCSLLTQAPPPIVDDGYVDDAEPMEVADVASVEQFESALAPYGDWVSVNELRAFRPSASIVGADFVPYASNGRWVSTEAGWSFASSLPFAWAAFHYGRWWFDPRYGWVWLPDTHWGPAWVDWRFGGGYAGWAPLPPVAFARFHHPRWFFVQAPYFGSGELFRYAARGPRYDSAYRVTNPIAPRSWRGSVWYSGPSYRDVAHVAVAVPERHSMRTYTPPPSFHGAVAPPRPSAPPVNRYVPPPPVNTYVPPPPSRGPSSLPPPPVNTYVPPPPSRAPSYTPPVRQNAPPPPSRAPSYTPPVGQNAPPPPVRGPSYTPPMRQNAPPPPPASVRPSAPAPGPAYVAPGAPHGSGPVRAPPTRHR
jgi:hypothetical protein